MTRFLASMSVFALFAAAPAFAQGWQDPMYPAAPQTYPTDAYSTAPVQTYPAYPAESYAYPTDAYTLPPAQDIAPQSGGTSADDIIFSGNIGAVTDYRHRGISRSDGPALQGGVQLGYRGVYGGVDASTVDLNLDSDADLEAQFFGGYKTQIDGIDVGGRLSYFAYPGGDNDDTDYWELALTGGYDFDVFYGSLTWATSPNYMNDSGMSLYYGADIVAPLPIIGGIDLTARGHLGFLFLDDENNYADDPMDWLIGLDYNWPEYDIDLGLTYTGTSLDDDECVEDCGSQLLLTAGKTFGWSN